MKKIYLLLLVSSFLTTVVSAQLTTNTVAPDWTLTDINGVEHTLYDYLDAGKVVYLKFSATWCGPCWNYHQGGVFSQMWDDYGPDGTDEAMLFFIEADPTTNTNCLYGNAGCNASTWGNWVENTPYPIIDLPDATVRLAYQVNAYPTVFSICPDTRVVRPWSPGGPPKATLETALGSCAMTAELTGTEDELCYGDQEGAAFIDVEEGHGNKTYSWSNGATTKDLLNVGQGIYSVTVSDQNNRELYLEDIEISGPESAVEYNVDELIGNLCAFNGEGSISVSAVGGTPTYSYLWNSGQTTPSINNLDGGSYILTITDENDCEVVSAAIIVEEPDELQVFLSVENETCDEENGELFISVFGGTPNYSIDAGWGPSEEGYYNQLSAGVYDVQVVDDNGCETESSIELENTPAPTAIISGDDFEFPCNESEIMLDGSESFGPGQIEYSWSTLNGNFVEGENTATPTIDMPGVYYLTVTDPASACQHFDQIVVDENSDVPLSVIAAAPMVTCDEPEVELDGSGSSQGEDYTYLWTTGNGNIVSGEESLFPIINAAGVYQLLVTNNDNGCLSSSSVEVLANGEFPELELTKSGDISCLNNEVLLSGLGSAEGDNISYTWENSDGEIIAEELEVNISSGGNYLFSVINEDNGCISVQSITIEENTELPNASAEVGGALSCVLNTIEIDGSGSSQGPEFLYVWTTEDGEIERGDSTLFPLVGSAGSYTLLVVNTVTGCENEFSIEVEEIKDEPEANYEFEAENLTIIFSNLSQHAQTYSWSFGDGNTSEEAEPEYTFAVHGTYEICLTITNDCGDDIICNTIMVAYSSVNSSPLLGHVSCFEGTDGFIQLAVTGNAPFQFDWSNGGSDQDLNGLEAGEYSVLITDDIGLTSELSFEIMQPEAIELAEVAIVDVVAGVLGSIGVEITGGVEPYTYLWSNGGEEASIENLGMGEYFLTLTDANDCETIFGPFKVDEVSSTNNFNGMISLNVYPNPFSSNIALDIQLENTSAIQLVVRNILGQVLVEKSYLNKHVQDVINTSEWPSGVYVLEVIKSGERAEYRLVK